MSDAIGSVYEESLSPAERPDHSSQQEVSSTGGFFLSDDGAEHESGPLSNAVIAISPNQDIVTVAMGGGVAFIGGIATRGINFVYSFVLVRGLGGEDFGLFTLALAVITLVGTFAGLGLELAVVRFGAIQARTEGQANIHRTTMVAMRISLAAALVFVVVLLASASSIAVHIFHKPQLASLIAGMSLCIPFMSVQALLLAATLALKTVKYSVLVRAAQPFAALVLAISLLALGGGTQAAAFSMVGSYIFGAGLAIYFYRRVVPRKDKAGKSIPVGQMLKFSLPLSLSQWLNFANQRTEVFFLGLLPRAVDVGIYNIAWRIAALETTFSESLGQIFAPFGSELSHRRQIKQLEKLYKATTRWAFAGALMLFAIFLLFPQAILGVFDPAFAAAGWVLISLGFAQLINALTGPCGMLLVMSGRSDLNLLNTILLLVTSIALDWLLIPSHGLAGAALAGALTVIIVNVLRVAEVWLTLKIHPFKWSLMGPLIAGISGWALVYALRTIVPSQSIMMDLAYAVLFVVVYITIIYLFKLDDEDKLVLKAIHQKMTSVLELARLSA